MCLILKQAYDIDPRKKTVYTKINEAFHHADTKLGWPFKSEGLGINHEIIMIALVNKFSLIVTCNNKPYKFSYESLKKALTELKTDYVLRNGVPLNILPINFAYTEEHSIDHWIEKL